MEEKYSVYSAFDIKKHKETYPYYLEVLIDVDGTVMYAVPSHQEKAINIACENLNKTRRELMDMCPKEYYFDFMTWLCKITGLVAVWDDFCVFDDITEKQINKLKILKMNGLYRGKIPKKDGSVINE